MKDIFIEMLDYLEKNSGLKVAFSKPNQGEIYSKKLIKKDTSHELIMVNWNLSQICLPHDHGESIGAVKILSGTVIHIIYSLNSSALKAVKVEIKKSGDTIISPKNMIHAMGNPTTDPLVTLHIYKNPINNMKVYDISKRKVAIVGNNCGAWWPTKQSQLIETTEF